MHRLCRALLALSIPALSIAPARAQGADACVAASSIAGDGLFAFDNSSATRDGAGDPLCTTGAGDQMDADVWFRWSAASSGNVVVETCALTTVDTMLAAYAASACPTGAALDCTDDDCGTQSRIQFQAMAGEVFLLRLGTFPGAPGGVGQFRIQTTLPPAGDDCAGAVLIAGEGTFSWDNTGATTDGVADGLCTSRGGQITNDVWFDWTPDFDGMATVSTCNLTGIDSELAAYDGGFCPPGPALACNDDTCGLQSRIQFSVVSGGTYLIRVGNFPNSAAGTGAIEIAENDQPWDCAAPPVGTDILVANLTDVRRWGTVGSITGYSIGATACNVGDAEMPWEGPTNRHPVITQNLYRYDGRSLEQIGLAWIKHGFGSATENLCCTCQNPGNSQIMGVGCADTYGSSTNGSQGGFNGVGGMGRHSDIDPETASFPFPYPTQGQTGDDIYKRLQVANADLDPALNPGARYFAEMQYVAPEDALAGHDNNNASHEEVVVGGLSGGGYDLGLPGLTRIGEPALFAWQRLDPGVQIETVDVPGGGRLFVASRGTDNGDGTWHYEYALYNLNDARGVGGFLVNFGGGTQLANFDFRGPRFHSSEVYDDTPWTRMLNAGSVSWRTVPFGANPDASAVRWSHTYNFGFDADAPPVDANVRVELFAPGNPDHLIVDAVVPGLPCGTLNYCFVSPNSVGPGAIIGASGSTSVAANDLVLEVSGGPPGRPGLFFYGSIAAGAVFGDGVRCVAGGTFRLYPIVFMDAAGTASHALDLTSPPNAAGTIESSDAWFFQFWYRDPGGPGGSGFNLSDGLRGAFCP